MKCANSQLNLMMKPSFRVGITCKTRALTNTSWETLHRIIKLKGNIEGEFNSFIEEMTD